MLHVIKTRFQLKQFTAVLAICCLSISTVGLADSNVVAESDQSYRSHAIIIHSANVSSDMSFSKTDEANPSPVDGLLRREERTLGEMEYVFHPLILINIERGFMQWNSGVQPLVNVFDENQYLKKNVIDFGESDHFKHAFDLLKIAFNPFIEITPGIEVFGRVGYRTRAAIGVRYYF